MNLKQTLLKQIIREEVSKQLRLTEALNKDLRQFGKDIAARLKSQGFDVGFFDGAVLSGSGFNKVSDVISKNPKAVALSFEESGWPGGDKYQMLAVYCSDASRKAVTNVLKKYQVTVLALAAPDVFVKSGKKYSTKMNPGDIYIQQSPEKPSKDVDGMLMWYYYRTVPK